MKKKEFINIYNRLNLITTIRLRRGGDARRKRKKSCTMLCDSKNREIVERYSIDRTSLIEQRGWSHMMKLYGEGQWELKGAKENVDNSLSQA